MKNIPKGLYCYSWIELPSKENKYIGKVKYCPYYQHKEDVEGVCTKYKLEILDSCKSCGIKEQYE